MTGLSKALLGATSRRDFLKATAAAASTLALGGDVTKLGGAASTAAASASHHYYSLWQVNWESLCLIVLVDSEL